MEAERPDATWVPAPPERPRVPRPTVHAALDQFVLSDGTKARVRITGAGPSLLAVFLDSHDNPLPGSPVELIEDFSESVGQTSIVGHWAPALRVRIAENAGHDGVLRVFIVYGGGSVRFFQYARNEVILDLGSAGPGVQREGTRWRLDSGSPYGGTFTCDELNATGMFDGPGTSSDFDPFAAVGRLAGADANGVTSELPGDAVFTLAHEFETLPYADGLLLGSITWGYTLTWTLADGPAAGPVPRPVTPLWRPPEKSESHMPDNLGSSWNPRATSGSGAGS